MASESLRRQYALTEKINVSKHHVAGTSDAGLGRKRNWCDTEIVQTVKTFRVTEIGRR